MLIDVDYHPCDPGIGAWYNERTEFCREALVVGYCGNTCRLTEEEEPDKDDGRWDAHV